MRDGWIDTITTRDAEREIRQLVKDFGEPTKIQKQDIYTQKNNTTASGVYGVPNNTTESGAYDVKNVRSASNRPIDNDFTLFFLI